MAVVSSSGNTGTQYAGGPTIDAATTTALGVCKRKGAAQCKVIYSACSEPLFEVSRSRSYRAMGLLAASDQVDKSPPS